LFELGVVSVILCEFENYILAVNACSVLIMAVLVYLMRSLVAFSPCSACCPIDDLCPAIFALPFLMLHVTACFACFAQKLVTYLASAFVNVSLMLRIAVVPRSPVMLPLATNARTSVSLDPKLLMREDEYFYPRSPQMLSAFSGSRPSHWASLTIEYDTIYTSSA
jgi:hypothetical protein